ncbi:MAG: RHS domain-containing protein [Kangiellaceae bacterium]|nr:RHS domain-containing protein [Kangiellaceae bacterium]MCW9017634.1 RHS domain-containing protein [Kangiellaceae bacterium]
MNVRKIFALVVGSFLLLSISLSQAAEMVTYYVNDALGSPVAAMDKNGALLWRESYNPYGETRLNPSANQNDVGFTGHQKDSTTGLTYMQARYYDPLIGRFYSDDPVKFDQKSPVSFNRYAYANNNPYKYVDPDGKAPILIPIVAFVLKEAAAEAASHATGGATDFLSVRRMGTKFVKYGGKYIKKHTVKDPRKRLNRSLNDLVGPPPGKAYQAAHIIPVKGFKSRKPAVQRAVLTAQRTFDKILGPEFRDTALNGFWAKTKHLGTHTNKFLLTLGETFKDVKTEKQLIEAMQKLIKRINNGEFIDR